MSVDPNDLPPTPIPIVEGIRTLYRLWELTGRGGGGALAMFIKGKRPEIEAAAARAREQRAVATPPIAPVPAARPQLPTGGDILDDLLRRPRVPAPPPPSEFERLMRRGPQTDFERLMDRPVRNADRPTVADRLPRGPGAATARMPAWQRLLVLARAAAANPVVAVIGGVLMPSPIAEEDPVRTRRRPGARRPPPIPPPGEVPVVVAPPQLPRSPIRTLPKAPDRVPSPPKMPLPAYIPAPYLPAPAPVPVPSAPPPPLVSPVGPSPLSLLPFLVAPFVLPSNPQPRPRLTSSPSNPLFVSPIPNTGGFLSTPTPAPAPGRMVAPLTMPLTAPLGSGPPSDRCNCTRTSKPRKKRCANPIISKRTRTENSRKFLTITRELKCP